MTKLEEISKNIPQSLFDLMKIRDLGPRTIYNLNKELGVEDLEDLKKVIHDGSFSKIEGLGDKKAEKILENMKFYEGKIGEFMPLINFCTKTHLGKQTAFGLGLIRAEKLK